MHRRFHAVLLPFCFVLLAVATAQTPRKTRSRSPNVKTGTLVSVDSNAATLVLKPRTGTDLTYRYTENTHILRDKKAVEATAFKPGDAIVVRFRNSSVGPAELYDLADKPSWEWLDRVRHETTLVTVKEVSDESLKAAEGTDGAEIEYRITDKTQCSRGGQSASIADFKAGEKVYVVPRLLPRGNLMATAISDSGGSAARLKERAGRSVTGVVKALDTTKRTLSLHSAAGDDRDLVLAPACRVRMASRDVPLTVVHPGITVTASLTRNEEDEQVVSRITIQTKRSGRRATSGSKTVRPKTP